MFKRVTAQQLHDEVGRIWIAPEIDEGHDMWMFEPGDETCFCLEATNELRLAGQLRTNLFDGYLAGHRWLHPAPHHRKRTTTELIE